MRRASSGRCRRVVGVTLRKGVRSRGRMRADVKSNRKLVVG